MEALWSLLSDYTFQIVALGAFVLGLISGMAGSFAVLRKQSLLGDGVSHAALPGVVMAFLLIGSKETEVLLLGALVSGLLATLLIIGIVRHSRIKFDSALALILSVFFGLGLVLLTFAQKIPDSNQAGLNRFIFGQASTLMQHDVVIMLICGAVLLILMLLFWKEFKLMTFDSEFAQSVQMPVRKLNLLLSFMIVLAIIIGLQTVGVILMSAMLIAPGVAARQWTNKLWVMVLLAALFGAVSGLIGTIASSMAVKLPTGPAVVVAISMISAVSLLFSPRRGVIYRLYKCRQNKKILKKREGAENVSSV